MITLNDLLPGAEEPRVHIEAPAHLRRLLVLIDEALALEAALENAPDSPRIDALWQKACRRTARRIDRLITGLEAHNRQELGQ